MKLLFPAVAVAFNVCAQILMERAAKHLQFSTPWLGIVGLAMLAYASSMLFYIRTLRDFPVGRVGPVVTVAVVLLIFSYGAMTGMKVKPVHLVGAVLAVSGIILLTR